MAPLLDDVPHELRAPQSARSVTMTPGSKPTTTWCAQLACMRYCMYVQHGAVELLHLMLDHMPNDISVAETVLGQDDGEQETVLDDDGGDGGD